MKKKEIIITVCFISILFCIYIPIRNLNTYSPYYVRKYDNNSNEIVLMTLISELDNIRPDELEGISYDYDGGPSITNSRDIGKKYKHYRYFIKSNNGYDFTNGENIYYLFDENFQITGALHRENGDEIPLSKIDRKRVISEIYDTVDPVLKGIGKPKINLQFLFDYLYKDDLKK